jgi:uncharacterized damage-inducible protein DinB
VASSPLRSPSEARQLLAYNREVFDRFVRRLSRLPWKEVTREREIGHRTLFATLVHVLNVHEVWMVYLVRKRTRELSALFADSSRHPTTWREFRRYSDRVWAGVEETVATLTVRDLDRPVRAPWFPKGRYTLGDGLLQTTFEEAHHLGEIIGALWQDDRASPPMTWIEVTRLAPRRRRRRR